MDDRRRIGVGAVRQLVDDQFPEWKHLPLRPVERDGWDNSTFRLGDTMKVRLPSASRYATQVVKEAAWLPHLAPGLPLPVPTPLALGEPADTQPWPWSIQSWLDGEPVSATGVRDAVAFAQDLAGFLAALRAIETEGAPSAGADTFFRGGALSVYDAEARAAIAALAGQIDAAAAAAVWDAALDGRFEGAPVWVHGDIAVGNLLLRGGRLAAVIDFGNAAVGDPACDLVIAWTFLEGDARSAFMRAIDADAGTWARARGWALWKALITAAGNGAPHPAERQPLDIVLALTRAWRSAPNRP